MPVTRRRRQGASDWSPEEVDLLQKQAESHRSTEEAWQKLADGGDDDDRWSAVEENLLSRDLQQENAERRWKFFSK